MMTANCAANQTQIPSTPHATVLSRPCGGGAVTGGGSDAEGLKLIHSRYPSSLPGARFSFLARRGLHRALAPQGHMVGCIAHSPLADAIAAAPFRQIDMDVVFMEAVGGRPEHGGEARAGAEAQFFTRIFGNRHIGQLVGLAVRERDSADVDRVSFSMFADFPTEHAIAPAAFIRVEIGDAAERRPKRRGDRRDIVAYPMR